MTPEQLEKFYAMAEPRSEEAIKKVQERKKAREEKKLLLKYLCMALPYGVKGKTLGSKTCTLTHLGKEGDFTADDYHGWLNSGQFIPYLRPLSSMTDEEREAFIRIGVEHSLQCIEIDDELESFVLGVKFHKDELEYLLERQYDVYGLIPMGLAIEVTNDNNPYKD